MFDLDHIAKLSKLKIREQDRKKLQEQMTQMVRFASLLPQLPITKDSMPEIDYGRQTQRMDYFGISENRERLLSGAPAQKDGCFFVPQVLQEENA